MVNPVVILVKCIAVPVCQNHFDSQKVQELFRIKQLSECLLALLLVRFTGEYGSLAAGDATDRLFTRLLGAVALQPIATAVAFAVLYRVSGVAWDLQVLGLPAVQEGI